MIKAEEISEIIKRQLQGYEAEIDLKEAGRVIEVGDGIARIYGLEKAMAGELLEFPGDVFGLVLNLEADNVGAVLLGDDTKIKEGDPVKRTKRIAQVPVGEALVGRVVNALGQPVDGKGPIDAKEFRTIERYAPGVVDRQLREGAAPDRHQGDRRHDPDRPRPARADHRRPPDRQDRHRHRHDHQPEGAGGLLHLRRHRPEALDGRPGREDARGHRRHGLHHRGHRLRLRVGAAAVHRALRRLRHGRVLPRHRPPRPLHLRRPVQARDRVPPALAAAAPAAGPRGVSGRRLLSPLAPARARGQAERRAGGRLADRAADHRDPARRRVGLHPDQRHLDHRRPDLPRVRPLLLRHPARRQRGHLGLARRRLRADQGHAAGRRQAAPRPRPVPRAGRLRPVRLRPRQGHPAPARARPAHGRAAEAGPVRAAVGREADRDHLRGHPGPPRRRAGGPDPRVRDVPLRVPRSQARRRSWRRSRTRRS